MSANDEMPWGKVKRLHGDFVGHFAEIWFARGVAYHETWAAQRYFVELDPLVEYVYCNIEGEPLHPAVVFAKADGEWRCVHPDHMHMSRGGAHDKAPQG